MTPPNVENPGDLGRTATPGYVSVPEAVWNSRTQWGAILAGAFAGFAVVILMSTLGAALGITAGAVSVNTAGTVNTDTAEKAATAFSIGTAIWILLTALATGLVGGWVLNSCSRKDRPYSSFIFGGITWAVGVCLALAVAAPLGGGMFSGLGGGAGGAASGAAAMSANRPDLMSRMSPQTRQNEPGAMQRDQNRPLTDEEKVAAKDAADKAAAYAAAALWVTLGAQLISIAATMFAAGWHRHTGTRVVTEIRPRPIPTL
jgi:hypothetical protein